jgi:hypothetical protein
MIPVLGTIDDGEPYFRRRFSSLRQGRNGDPSILPEPGRYFYIRRLSEKEDIELADALPGKHKCDLPQVKRKIIRIAPRRQ